MESVPTQKVPINARVLRATPQAAIHRDVSVSNRSQVTFKGPGKNAFGVTAC